MSKNQPYGFREASLKLIADQFGISEDDVEETLPELWSDPCRYIGADLKEKVMQLINSHPAGQNSGVVYAALVEVALAVGYATFRKDARKHWIGAFDAAEHRRRPRV